MRLVPEEALQPQWCWSKEHWLMCLGYLHSRIRPDGFASLSSCGFVGSTILKLEPPSRGVEGPVASILRILCSNAVSWPVPRDSFSYLGPTPSGSTCPCRYKALLTGFAQPPQPAGRARDCWQCTHNKSVKKLRPTVITMNMVKIARPIKIKHVEQRQQWQQQQCNPEYACLKEEMQAMRQMMR